MITGTIVAIGPSMRLERRCLKRRIWRRTISASETN
jgi:hypothetical protein